MMSKNEQIRAAIAEQAAEWFVANDSGPLPPQEAAALTSWLKASPLHVEEFLRVSMIARDLGQASADSEDSLEALVARARGQDETVVESFWSRISAPFARDPSRRWQTAAVALATLSVVGLGLPLLWSLRPAAPPLLAPSEVATLHFETRHGEQQTHVLADKSVVRLNTDSAVTIHYSKMQRLVVLESGEAEFDVVHEPARELRVLAGSAEVLDLGTRFVLRLENASTRVTVVEGRVAVRPSTKSNQSGPMPQFVQVAAGQQLNVTDSQWPATPIPADIQGATAWLRQQIFFDLEPLDRVAAELNRYAPKPIEISTPSLKGLQVSGVFRTDNMEAFIAFLRSLDGVQVEETATRIVVSQKPAAARAITPLRS